MLSLSRIHYPVTVLGPGRRVGIWVQGCAIRCHGCVSADTWAPDAGGAAEVDDIVAWVTRLPADQVDGVTISGGEPFDQPAAVSALVDGLSGWRSGLPHDVDLLCYTGYSASVARRRAPRIVSGVDAMVCGPFIQSRPTTRPLRGSANQRLIPLSELGFERYGQTGPAADDGRPRLQVEAAGDDLWLVGIPRVGDLPKLRAMLALRGVELGEVSWTS